MLIGIKLLENYGNSPAPEYSHHGDSGLDIRASVGDEIIVIQPHSTAKIPTGIALSIEDGHEVQVRPRSSMSAKGILCHFGTVDGGYTGEVFIVLTNLTNDPFLVRHGDRIAQMVPSGVAKAIPILLDKITKTTTRGANGFGSTGH